MDNLNNINKNKIFLPDNSVNNPENKYWWESLFKWWSGFSLRTKLLAIATLVVSLLMTGITFFALNSIQRDAMQHRFDGKVVFLSKASYINCF